MGADRLHNQILYGIASLADGNTHYILVPYRKIVLTLLRMTMFAAIPYFFTINIFMFGAFVPIYLYFIYMNYLFFSMVKLYGFKLLPTVSVILLVNICCIILIIFIRRIIVHMILF